MNYKKTNRLLWVFLVLSLLIAVATLIFGKRNTEKKTNKKTLVEKGVKTFEKDTASIRYDLYFLEHPYVQRAHQLNEERNYDSAVYYYIKASKRFEEQHQWASYIWVNSYIGRLHLYVAGKNPKDALPYLRTALEVGNQRLRGKHPYIAATYLYLGLYYYEQNQAETALQWLNKALEMVIAHYGEENIYASDIYDALGK